MLCQVSLNPQGIVLTRKWDKVPSVLADKETVEQKGVLLSLSIVPTSYNSAVLPSSAMVTVGAWTAGSITSPRSYEALFKLWAELPVSEDDDRDSLSMMA